MQEQVSVLLWLMSEFVVLGNMLSFDEVCDKIECCYVNVIGLVEFVESLVQGWMFEVEQVGIQMVGYLWLEQICVLMCGEVLLVGGIMVIFRLVIEIFGGVIVEQFYGQQLGRWFGMVVKVGQCWLWCLLLQCGVDIVGDLVDLVV